MGQAIDQARLFLASVERGDAAACGRFFAEHGAMLTPFSPPGLPQASLGRAGCEATLTNVFAMLDTFAWKNIALYPGADPDVVFGTAESQAVVRGGAIYVNRYCFLFRFAQGLIEEYTEYFDPQPVIALFGAMLAEAAP